MSSMNKENFNSQEKSVFIPQESGVSDFEKKRREWLKKGQAKKQVPNYQQYETLEEDIKQEVYEVIESTKPPYQKFEKYIKLKDMVECLNEVWSWDE